MALVGLVTLQLLGYQYIEDLGRRAREKSGLFDRSRVHVFEDAASETGKVPAMEGGA